MQHNNVLETPIEYLKGVGPQRGELLKKELQIFTFQDLLNFYPYKYLDRTRYYKINELSPSLTSEIQITGRIIHLKMIEQKRGKRLVATFTDGSSTMELIWFQGIKWIKDNIKINEPYVIFGKINHYNGTFSMPHPEMETVEEHKSQMRSALQPVYSSNEKLQQRGITNKTIQKLMQNVITDTHHLFVEIFPDYLMQKLQLMSKKEAFLNVHFPKDSEVLGMAQFRLKFEELFLLQLQLLSKNIDHKKKIKGMPFEKIGPLFNDFFNEHLPFPLTGAQKRVLKEIRTDMAHPVQMNRLLQGDVGSGKTMVALLSMLIALDNGFQAALIAPTEILAQQHYNSIVEMLGDMEVEVALLTGSVTKKKREPILENLASGKLQIIIGTHALLEDTVVFKNLGLSIIDEQHRFGVAQRAKFWRKAALPPHILVMTATPIPRTLSMTLYGDLDVSVIDELPQGRKPIKTISKTDSHRLQLFSFMKSEIDKGRQVYIVYPLIEESEKLDLKDLMDGFESISREFPLPKYAVGIVHGKQKAADKEFEMQRFKRGETQILVATTVIAVGVNVPNASVMIIENSERFGLSQLHQLRGRVGRGAEQSYCILMVGGKLNPISQRRIDAMCETNDGFKLAEIDLELRGPGDMMGTQQSGVLDFKLADITKDKNILKASRTCVEHILQHDPLLEHELNRPVKEFFMDNLKEKVGWSQIS